MKRKIGQIVYGTFMRSTNYAVIYNSVPELHRYQIVHRYAALSFIYEHEVLLPCIKQK